MRLTNAQRDLLHRLRTLPDAELWLRRVGPTWVDASLVWKDMPWQETPDDPDPGYVDLRDALRLLKAGLIERPIWAQYERRFYQVSLYYERCKAKVEQQVMF